MKLETATNILLCLRYGIGDLVMELPAIAALRAARPQARITGLGAHPAIELLQGERGLDALVTVQSFGYREWSDPGTELSNTAFAEWYRAQRFDAVLDPSHTVFGAAAAIWREGAPCMYDVSRELQSRALALGLRGYEAVRHAVLEGWGIAIPADARPALALTAQEHAAAGAVLLAARMGNRPLAAVATAASSPLKRWPVQRFAAVAEYLSGAGYAVLALGTPEETPEEKAMLSAHATWFGPQHLRVTAALLENCRLLVCNDTGLMHLAALVGCPVVPVFGPTSPSIYAPSGAAVVGEAPAPPCRKDLEFGPTDCVIRGACAEGAPGCIARITVDQVLAAVERIVRGDRAWQPPTAY
ncbi:MAG: glycosyltransferase family 9 protein [Thiohalomonadaceae bacterium]